jgi:hypothetical protein
LRPDLSRLVETLQPPSAGVIQTAPMVGGRCTPV